MQTEAYTLGEISSRGQSVPHKKTKPCVNDADRKIGMRMLIAREEVGMTRLEIANSLNITQQQIEKYEKGGNRISARTLFILAKLFGKPMAWFTQDLEDPNNEELLIKHSENRLAIRTIRKIHNIKDKPTQDKIIKIIKIIADKAE